MRFDFSWHVTVGSVGAISKSTFILLVSAVAVWSQSSAVSGALEGSVTDSSGGRIPGVSVKLREISTNRAREAVTNAEGTFRLPELTPGTYEVEAGKSGFAPYKHSGVTVALGSATHLDMVL